MYDIEETWPLKGMNPSVLMHEVAANLVNNLGMEKVAARKLAERMMVRGKRKGRAFKKGTLEISPEEELSTEQWAQFELAIASHDGDSQDGFNFVELEGAHSMTPFPAGHIVYVSNARRPGEGPGNGTGNIVWWDGVSKVWRRIDNGDSGNII